MDNLQSYDSRAEAETYLRGVLGKYHDAPRIKACLDHGPEMMTWLEQHTDVRFEASDIPDYEAEDVDGWKINRTIGTTIYDGKKLGKLLQQLRPPKSGTNGGQWHWGCQMSLTSSTCV